MPDTITEAPRRPPAPIDGYNDMTVPDIARRIPQMSREEVTALRDYEKSTRRRKTLLVRLERLIRNNGWEK